MPTLKELPAPAKRSDVYHEQLAHHPGIHQAVKAFYGSPNRDVPGEILDDELLDTFVAVYQELGDWALVGEYVRKHTTREDKIQARGVLINLARLKRENGGTYPWVK